MNQKELEKYIATRPSAIVKATGPGKTLLIKIMELNMLALDQTNPRTQNNTPQKNITRGE